MTDNDRFEAWWNSVGLRLGPGKATARNIWWLGASCERDAIAAELENSSAPIQVPSPVVPSPSGRHGFEPGDAPPLIRKHAPSLLVGDPVEQSGQDVEMVGAGIFPKPPGDGVIYAYATGKPSDSEPKCPEPDAPSFLLKCPVCKRVAHPASEHAPCIQRLLLGTTLDADRQEAEDCQTEPVSVRAGKGATTAVIGSVLTGSHAYGVPTAQSDIDLVVLAEPAVAGLLEKAFGGPPETEPASQNYPSLQLKIGKLNLIVETQPAMFDIWVRGTAELVSRKPVSREDAKALFISMQEQLRAPSLSESVAAYDGGVPW